MTVPVRIQSKAKGIWFNGLPEKLSKAVDAYDLASRPDWSQLDELSSQTLLEGIEVYGDAAVIEGDTLVAPATVYVRLQYDVGSPDAVEMNERFPASVYFSVEPDPSRGDGKSITVIEIKVDTSSFF